MKKVIFSILFISLTIFMISLLSADILISQQPNLVYNIGDKISIPVTLKPVSEVTGNVVMNLVCGGNQVNFYNSGIDLAAGQQSIISPILILKEGIIGNLSGNCNINISLGTESAATSNFKISNSIVVSLEVINKVFNPGETVTIRGTATKDNGNSANGFVNITLISSGPNPLIQNSQGTVNNGVFSVDMPLQNNAPAEQYLVNVSVYEEDFFKQITNNGRTNENIQVNSVPTSLEIVFENNSVMPGSTLDVKAVLHDQTGIEMNSTSIITIKDSNNKIIEQSQEPTGQFLELSFNYDEPPSQWTAVAVSNKLISQANFQILPNEDAKFEIINRTLIVTNVGNVFYNKTLLIKIGNDSLNINPQLPVDGVKKYILNAPSGNYNVQVIDNGQKEVDQTLTLTGNVIGIQEAQSGGLLSSNNYIIGWVFLILVLGFVAFIFTKKLYKKSFVKQGYVSMGDQSSVSNFEVPTSKNSLLKTKNKAELSLTIKGEKQPANLICLKVKNSSEVEKNESSVKNTIQEIINLVENNKGIIYENDNNFFFIFAPITTKTFKNEKTAIKTAGDIKTMIIEHNRKFKQKIGFGISVNTADIIVSKKDVVKFMVLGNSMNLSKKIASASDEEVYLTEGLRQKLMSDVKTEKHEIAGLNVYTVRDIIDDEQRKKFTDDFIKRLDRY